MSREYCNVCRGRVSASQAENGQIEGASSALVIQTLYAAFIPQERVFSGGAGPDSFPLFLDSHGQPVADRQNRRVEIRRIVELAIEIENRLRRRILGILFRDAAAPEHIVGYK